MQKQHHGCNLCVRADNSNSSLKEKRPALSVPLELLTRAPFRGGPGPGNAFAACSQLANSCMVPFEFLFLWTSGVPMEVFCGH